MCAPSASFLPYPKNRKPRIRMRKAITASPSRSGGLSRYGRPSCLEPVDVTSTQITKSVSGDGDGSKRGSDTMGMKHRVDEAVYVFYGSMNPQLAERTGFSDADADAIKQVLPKLFENDASSARPDGSMEVLKVLWWKHNSRAGQFSSAKVHRSLRVAKDGTYTLTPLKGLPTEEIDGF